MPREGPATLVANVSFWRSCWVFGEPVADDRSRWDLTGLGRGGHGIHLGGVNEVDAGIQRPVHDGVRVGLIDLFAKSHGAKANGRDMQIGLTELDEFHGVSCVVLYRSWHEWAAHALTGRLFCHAKAPVPDALASSCSRSTRRCTLPVVVMGSCAMNSISLGYS